MIEGQGARGKGQGFDLVDLGLVPYREAWELQKKIREERINKKIPDRILLLEHPPVFTTGRRECGGDFCSTAEAIANDGIEIVKTNRGGRVTYHGPGQLVCYFIFDLDELGIGVKDFVRTLEEISINLLSGFDIKAHRDVDHPGIWIGRKKIVAIGLNVSHGVTMHGIAINVDCDLSPYRHIIACGIKDRSVTTMAIETSPPPAMENVKLSLKSQISSLNLLR